MAQNPLPPPPPSGGVLDGWLYLLWRRLTQTGQILWDSITPGTSADVAAVVTDETGSPGSLVFSGNPTLAGVTNSGNLVFTGTGTRIIGDFSNATFSNRAMWQTSTVDSSTTLGIIPNGTGPNGTLNLYNNSNPTNAGRLALTCGNGEAAIFSTIHGSGTYVPLGVYVNNVETARFALNGVNTFGGASTAPALKVTPVASQARWIEVTGATSSGNPTIGVSGGNLATSAVFMPVQATTAGAPAYVLGGMYYDTTLNKLRIGGATAWETVTSV